MAIAHHYIYMMDYLELKCTVPEPGVVNELLIAYLDSAGFTMFQETPQGLMAYIPRSDFDDTVFRNLPVHSDTIFDGVEFEISDAENRNWNAEWESSFQPVEIEKFCRIRASFHDKKEGFKHDVVIDPKMAFGTGHHETTYMVTQQLMEVDLSGNTVLDYGCGTGILSIVSMLEGAHKVVAIDIEEDAVSNTLENIRINQVDGVRVVKGDLEVVEESSFHIILANINRHVLIAQSEALWKKMHTQSLLIMSGILRQDEALITDVYEKLHLRLQKRSERGEWICLTWVK